MPDCLTPPKGASAVEMIPSLTPTIPASSTRSCLVTRSALGSSAFLSVLAAATRSAFDSTDRGGFLALAAGDVTLRRDAVFDWALPFFGAALFVFRAFLKRGSLGLRVRG